MTRYIIEYTAGSKGDLLCRFLNNSDPKFIKANRTQPADVDYINWLKLANPDMLTLDRFEEVLDKNNNKYIPAHCLWVTVDKNYELLLKSYNYEIIKLVFEPKHFKTIRIESIIKNMVQDILPTQVIDLINSVWYKRFDWNTFTLNDLNGRVKEIDEDVMWDSRADVFKLFIENCNENKTLVDYEDLYINFSSDLLKGYDLDKWKSLVEKSWCDFEGSGYREYNQNDKIIQTRYGKKIVSYLKENNYELRST
jgi:hypothetical protein